MRETDWPWLSNIEVAVRADQLVSDSLESRVELLPSQEAFMAFWWSHFVAWLAALLREAAHSVCQYIYPVYLMLLYSRLKYLVKTIIEQNMTCSFFARNYHFANSLFTADHPFNIGGAAAQHCTFIVSLTTSTGLSAFTVADGLHLLPECETSSFSLLRRTC